MRLVFRLLPLIVVVVPNLLHAQVVTTPLNRVYLEGSNSSILLSIFGLVGLLGIVWGVDWFVRRAPPRASSTRLGRLRPIEERARVRRSVYPMATIRRRTISEAMSSSTTGDHAIVDDLTHISGIGPAAAALLVASGIDSFKQLSGTSLDHLNAVLHQGGKRFGLLDPINWSMQASLADAGEWDALAAMQLDVVNKCALKSSNKSDQLDRIEGIGPKISRLLRGHGITTFVALSQASPDQLRDALKRGGSRFAPADPQTWPEQAALAATGRWAALIALQAQLNGGKRQTATA